MLKLTDDDKVVIDNGYKNFLYNLKFIFKNSEIKSALVCYKILTAMLRNGQFSIEKNIIFDDEFKYLSLSNMNNIGTQVMYGVCCCRHANILINDILQVLGFDTSLLYIFIDENAIWHQCHPKNANHVTILLNDNSCEYILDPVNNFLLKKEEEQRLTLLDSDISNKILQQFTDYSDVNIQNIGKVLKKYYNYQKLEINHTYDYRF